MDRRQYLATSAGIAGVSLAGCTAFADEIVLGAPTGQQDDQSVRFVFEHENEELLRVFFNKQPATPAIDRLRVYVEQPDNTTLDDYRFRFKPDPAIETSAAIYLHPPRAGHADKFDTYRDNNWTVIEVPEYDNGRRVTTGFEVLVHSDVQSDSGHLSVLTDYEITFSGEEYLADTFVAGDQATIDFEETE